MKPEDVLQYYPSRAAACRALYISRQCFTSWVKRGYVPYRQQLKFEKITNGVLKADVEHTQFHKESINDNKIHD